MKIGGKAGSGRSDGYGLAKIEKFHPEVLDRLEELVQDLPITKETPNRYQLENENYKIAIRKDYDGEKENWILTAFEKKESIARRRTDLPSTETATEKTTSVNANTNSTTKFQDIANEYKELIQNHSGKELLSKDLLDLINDDKELANVIQNNKEFFDTLTAFIGNDKVREAFKQRREKIQDLADNGDIKEATKLLTKLNKERKDLSDKEYDQALYLNDYVKDSIIPNTEYKTRHSDLERSEREESIKHSESLKDISDLRPQYDKDSISQYDKDSINTHKQDTPIKEQDYGQQNTNNTKETTNATNTNEHRGVTSDNQAGSERGVTNAMATREAGNEREGFRNGSDAHSQDYGLQSQEIFSQQSQKNDTSGDIRGENGRSSFDTHSPTENSRDERGYNARERLKESATHGYSQRGDDNIATSRDRLHRNVSLSLKSGDSPNLTSESKALDSETQRHSDLDNPNTSLRGSETTEASVALAIDPHLQIHKEKDISDLRPQYDKDSSHSEEVLQSKTTEESLPNTKDSESKDVSLKYDKNPTIKHNKEYDTLLANTPQYLTLKDNNYAIVKIHNATMQGQTFPLVETQHKYLIEPYTGIQLGNRTALLWNLKENIDSLEDFLAKIANPPKEVHIYTLTEQNDKNFIKAMKEPMERLLQGKRQSLKNHTKSNITHNLSPQEIKNEIEKWDLSKPSPNDKLLVSKIQDQELEQLQKEFNFKGNYAIARQIDAEHVAHALNRHGNKK